ncbi:MAG: hypothetical protein RBR47_01255 [Bacteroidales bacterium]|nr:hypothetical protein [Bacteroidales bacterium]NCU34947.1 hypothetical protein [Candidatus Falkowbacteria bacterium]MDD2632592.1 hypothetical protein [Bacteroidales bacterium]MDD3527039.1 hypothetical protein [Bacteroidales bacterium]MDD4176065.1 hypothetical protein [Bacteroidales bacterium]
MQINQNNYPAWFLDYWDNALDALQQQELAAFLQNYPDLHDEFLEFKDAARCTLTPDDVVVYEPKRKLKKKEVLSTENIHQDNYEDFIIAHLEHDLDEKQQTEFASFTALNPTLENEIRAYRHTFLNAADQVSFPDKQKLKKSVSLVPPRHYIISALSIAALLVLVLMITNSLFRQPTENSITTASNEIALQPLPPQENPVIQVEKSADDVSVNSAVVDAKQMTARTSPPYDNSDKSNAKTNSILPARESLPPPTPVERVQWDLEHQLAANQILDYRTEVTQAFEYMLLRDARAAQTEPSESILARIAGSIVGTLFDNADLQQQNPLLATLTQNHRQLLMDIKEDMPLLDAATYLDADENYFALSENFSIRIRKAPKNER